MLADHARSVRAHQSRRHHEVLLPERQESAAHLPSEGGPAEQGEDDRNAEVNEKRRPVHRQRRGERHPQGEGRQALQHFDHLVHGAIHETAQVAGETSKQDAQDDGQHHPHDADGKGNPAAEEHAREHVPTQGVGAEEVDVAALVHGEQVAVHLEQVPHLVGFAAGKEADGKLIAGVFRVYPDPCVRVDLHVVGIHERAQLKLALGVEEVDAHGRGVDGLIVAGHGPIRGDELAKGGEGIQHQQECSADQGQAMAPKPQPHQLPRRYGGDLFGSARRDQDRWMGRKVTQNESSGPPTPATGRRAGCPPPSGLPATSGGFRPGTCPG